MSSHVTDDNNICIEKVQHLVYNGVVELDHGLGSQEIDEYTLLPALWQAMSPVDKKTAATIVQRFTNNAWGLDCCSALITALKIKM